MDLVVKPFAVNTTFLCPLCTTIRVLVVKVLNGTSYGDPLALKGLKVR